MITLYRADEVFEMDIPEREDVIAGLVPRGDAVLLSAREKDGKGLITLDMCACVASGETFLGRAVTQGPAVYLALEEGKRTIRDRWKARVGETPSIPIYVAFLDGSMGETFRLDDADSIQDVLLLINQYRPVLIVLDVLREAHNGRENESDDMVALIRPIRQLAHEYNVAIVVTHHASKAGGYRGSTAIAAAFDDTFDFVRDDPDGGAQVQGVLTARGRDLPKVVEHITFDPKTFRWSVLDAAPTVSQPTNVRGKVLAALNSTDDWLTAEQITNRIEGAKLKSVQNELATMTRETYCQLLIEGTGTRTNPRRFHGIHRRGENVPPDSGNGPGANEADTSGNEADDEAVFPGECVDCGAPLPAGRRYRCHTCHAGEDAA